MHDVFLHFQTDGPSNALLTFRHSYVTSSYPPGTNRYTFDVNMDATFNTTTTLSRTIKGEGSLSVGGEKSPVKGEIGGGAEFGKQYQETVVTLHARIVGDLDPTALQGRLQVHGSMVGNSVHHKDK